MRKIVDLTETAPGVWGMALRIARRKRTPEEAEASREAFFNSLAGKSTKRHYAFEGLHWGWLVFGFYTLPIISETLRRYIIPFISEVLKLLFR